MNYEDLYKRLEKELAVRDAPVFWEKTELQDLLNEAQDDVIIDVYDPTEISPVAISTTNIMTTSNTANYTAPTNLAVVQVLYEDNELFPTSEGDLSRESAGWRTADAGTPTRFYWKDRLTVGLNPKPNVTNGTLAFEFIPPSTVMTATNETPGIDSYLHLALVYSAGESALAKEGEGSELQKAIQYFGGKYAEVIARYKKMRRMSMNRTKVLRPATKRDRAFSSTQFRR